jgi:nucleoside-diphosphate-sugar epimerase
MRVLITGASGFLGSHIAEAFVQHGHTVAAIVRPSPRVDFLRSLGVELRQARLEHAHSLRRAIQDADVLVHTAAKVHTHGFWRDFVRTTIEGTRNTLQAAIEAGIGHYIQISTVGVYGFPRTDGAAFDETAPYGSPYRWNYYSRAKIEAEKLVRDAQSKQLLATTILRPTWVYGPRDTTSVQRLAAALRTGRYKWIGDGTNRLSLVYATDVANAVVLAATSPRAKGEIYNVAADETSPTQREFVARVCESLALPLPTASVSYRVAHRLAFASECVAHFSGYRVCPPLTRLAVLLMGGNRRYHSEKIRRELGWQPIVSFAEGIEAALRWYRARTQSPQLVSSP